MQYRRFGRLGWQVSEVGLGMWGMGSWKDSDDAGSAAALARAVDGGCNFFDTAFAYGDGHSERLLGALVRARAGGPRLYLATKIPPKNQRWPARPEYPLGDVYPPDHIRAFLERSLENLGVPAIDLVQLHVWNDGWAEDESWQRALDEARREGLVRGVGISVNRWDPTNVLRALRTGVVDAVQVVYNVFDQNPEDELFPLCQELDIAVIARVPFDEGSLTDKLTADSRWPEGDWRNGYFSPENLAATLARVERLRPLVPPGTSMADLALRFVLASPAVATVIPGMRQLRNVDANLGASDGRALPPELRAALRAHRWDRGPSR